MIFDKCMQLGSHYRSHNQGKIQNFSITLKSFLTCLCSQSLASVSAPGNRWSNFSSYSFAFSRR